MEELSPTIRPIQTTDIPTIVKIAQQQEYPWTEKMFVDCLQTNYHNWLLENQQQTVGYLIFSMLTDEIEILDLAIDKKNRQQGLGKFLIEKLIEFAKENKQHKIFLEVRASNTAARSLYEKCGFVQQSIRKAYYAAGEQREDAIIYCRDI